jgi:AraC-like DNA-binding protein
VDLTPLGASAVLGVPGGELAGQVVALDNLLGRRGRDLTERLLHTPGWPARFRLLDHTLAAGVSERQQPPDQIQEAWARLVTHPGDLDVDGLARDVGWSRRHLTEQVRRQIGLPPRQLARILRFERSCTLLRCPADNQRTLTDVAMASGYFDHAHMVHEWQRLAGCTPTAWLQEALPPVQDGPPADGAS